MKFLNKLERKIGRYAIPNLTLIIVICFTIGYMLEEFMPEIYYRLVFAPYLIIQYGEWWRLFTWIFTTPFAVNIFTLIALFFYYRIGTELEAVWGKFLYNLYIFGGLFFITLGVMVAQIICMNIGYGYVTAGYLDVTYYLVLSMYLAFASIYPDAVVYFCFVLPLKMKWMAYIDLIYLLYLFVVGDLFGRIVIAACVLNFFVYYFIANRKSKFSIKQKKRKFDYKKQVRKGEALNRRNARDISGRPERAKSAADAAENNIKKINYSGTVHKCAICGRTEKDSDDLEFRFCSKCNGNYEYCNEHLFTHEHVK